MTRTIMDFIEDNYQDLLAFSVRLNGNWADGEDVLQTVAAKICLKQKELETLAHAKSYLMTCIRNATFNQKRAAARRQVFDAKYQKLKEDEAEKEAQREFEVVEWVETLNRHLEYYDEALRKAFIAYYVDQVPFEDVAASLGLTKRQTTKKFESMRVYLKRHSKNLFTQLCILLSM